MDSTDKEMRKAFEEVAVRNITTCVDHSNETRRMVRVLEETVTALSNLIVNQNNEIAQLRAQMALIQVKIYSGGTTT